MIKWFDSRVMGGLPELATVQGDLVKMLNGLLVNGANIKPITTISYANGFCTLELGAGHGFVKHSVIDIQGSAQPYLAGKELRISATTVTTISFASAIAVTAETGLTVRYMPLGWTQHFASEGKSCYRSPDPRYPAYLRVDDSAYTGTDTSLYTNANVEICADMIDFDTASWQSPYDIAKPLKNRARVARTDGWLKWIYSYHQSGSKKRDFILIGDERSFWVLFYPYNSGLSLGACAVVGMPLVSIGSDTKQCLVATDTGKEYAANYGLFASKSDATTSAVFLGDLGRGFPAYYSTTKHSIDKTLLRYPVIWGAGAIMSGYFEGVFTTPSLMDNSVLLRSNDRFYKVVSIGEPNYSVVFDFGEP